MLNIRNDDTDFQLISHLYSDLIQDVNNCIEFEETNNVIIILLPFNIIILYLKSFILFFLNFPLIGRVYKDLSHSLALAYKLDL